jgi:GNAT superfamily N-acetyltransferase
MPMYGLATLRSWSARPGGRSSRRAVPTIYTLMTLMQPWLAPLPPEDVLWDLSLTCPTRIDRVGLRTLPATSGGCRSAWYQVLIESPIDHWYMMEPRSALNDISIRIAINSDVPGISRLLRSLSHTYIVSPDDPEVAKFLATLSEGAISKFIERRDVVYVVAVTRTAQLVGAAAIGGNQRVEHLFVDPAYQGMGLGRRLWEHLRDHALQSGNPGLFIVNSRLNAVPIYEHLGFAIAAPKVERYGGAYVPMILRLAASP